MINHEAFIAMPLWAHILLYFGISAAAWLLYEADKTTWSVSGDE